MAEQFKSAGRQARLAAALRENLKRRKERARELSGTAPSAPVDSPSPPASRPSPDTSRQD